AFLQAIHLLLCLLEMVLERQLETLGVGGFRDLRQRLDELTLGAQEVAQLLYQKLLNHLRFADRTRRSIVDSRLRFEAPFVVADSLERGSFDELPFGALIPRTTCVDLAVFTLSRRVIEELVHQAGRWRDSSDRKTRLVQT